LEQKTCNKSVELNNLVTSCQQAVDNLSTSWEQAVRTHPVDKLLEQNCHKSAAGLLQLVRFYVCKVKLMANTFALCTKLGEINWKNGCLKMLKSQNVTNVPCYNVLNKQTFYPSIKLLIVLEHYTNVSKRCSAKLLKSCLNIGKHFSGKSRKLNSTYSMTYIYLFVGFTI
jgi:hypothetical protein